MAAPTNNSNKLLGNLLFLALSSFLVVPVEGFIEEILSQFANGGGGGAHFEMGGGGGDSRIEELLGGLRGARESRKKREAAFPDGVENKIGKEFNWLRGTQWNWEDDTAVRFVKDGTLEAQNRICMMTSDQCKWAANTDASGRKRIYVVMGEDVHTMQVSKRHEFPTGQADLEGLELVGKDNSRKPKQIYAVFDKVYDHKAFAQSINLYDVLGFDESLNPEDIQMRDIKKSYRGLSLQYHPDKNPNQSNADKELFAQINNAYEILSDESKRAKYDCCGMEGVEGEVKQGDGMDLHANVSLEELYSGVIQNKPIRRRTVCRGCRDDQDPHSERCRRCNKCPAETKTVHIQVGRGMIMQQQQEVESKEKCRQASHELKIEVERGMADGDTLKFPHKGEQSPGELPGDVTIHLNMRKHHKFTRKHNDLHMDLKISLKEALLGFEREIEHLDGHMVTVSHDKPTQPYQVFKIADEGMPFRNDPTRFGKLYVRVEVEFPKRELSAEQKAGVEKMFGEEHSGRRSYRQEL